MAKATDMEEADMRAIRISNEQEAWMIGAYKSGETGKEIGRALGIGTTLVYKLLRKAGITLQTAREAARRYIVNESYFADIDCPEKAYWLGFLAADGNVQLYSNPPRNAVIIELARRDEAHLELMANELQANVPVFQYQHNGHPTSRITICSEQMVNDLIRHGITPAKSLILQPWRGPSELLRHYWRGVYDGDGHICHYDGYYKPTGYAASKPRRQVWEIGLVGTEAIVRAFAAFMHSHGVGRVAIRKQRNIFRVLWNALTDTQTTVKVLYDSATVSLERKRLLAEELLTVKLRQPCRSDITAEQLQALYARYGDWHKIARELDCSYHSVWQLRKRLNIYKDTRPGKRVKAT